MRQGIVIGQYVEVHAGSSGADLLQIASTLRIGLLGLAHQPRLQEAARMFEVADQVHGALARAGHAHTYGNVPVFRDLRIDVQDLYPGG